jgi:hypothetical protein
LINAIIFLNCHIINTVHNLLVVLTKECDLQILFLYWKVHSIIIIRIKTRKLNLHFKIIRKLNGRIKIRSFSQIDILYILVLSSLDVE